jgi:hypothetical protein
MEFAIPAISPKAASLRFWYGASIAEFAVASAEEIVGQLTLNSSFDVDRTQAAAWLAQIEFLQSQLNGLAGSIFFEFNIPRMGRLGCRFWPTVRAFVRGRNYNYKRMFVGEGHAPSLLPRR